MRRALLTLVTLAFTAVPAAAQDLMMGGINQSWTSTQLLLNSEKKAWAAPECVDDRQWSTDCKGPRPRAQQNRRAPQALNLDGGTRTPAGGSAVSEAALTFRPSMERRQRNFAQFVEKSRAADPAHADELRAFLSQDVIGFVRKEVAPLGLRTDNVADAVAIYVEEAWQAANAKVLPPSRARSQAVRAQMVRAIGGNPAFASADDATKQEMAEAMMVQAVMASNAIKMAVQKGDRSEIAAVQAAVRKGARASLGIDLRAMALTDAGLQDGQDVSAVEGAPATAVPAGDAGDHSAVLLAAGVGVVGAALGVRALVKRAG